MIRRYLLPLLLGVAIGTLLAAVYFVVTTGSFIGSPIQRARGAAAVAALYAVPIAAICALLWRALASMGRQGFMDAAALGFVITPLAWVSTNYNGTEPFGAVLSFGLPYAICGGLAAIATWLVGRRTPDRG